jgi:hypothetical protein
VWRPLQGSGEREVVLNGERELESGRGNGEREVERERGNGKRRLCEREREREREKELVRDVAFLSVE